VAAGDPDLENATDLEDDHALSSQATGYWKGMPGCPASDSDDRAWVEWDKMRGRAKTGPNFTLGDEDAEEDDPSGQSARTG
jgi:hypothetical protein